MLTKQKVLSLRQSLHAQKLKLYGGLLYRIYLRQFIEVKKFWKNLK